MKRLLFGLVCCSVLFLQSCFEIIEQLVVKDDGSGNFQLVVNMSKSKTKINSIRKMKKVNGRDVPTKEEIVEKVSEIEKNIKNTTGITDVKSKLDWDNYIATLNFNFSKVSNLNVAIRNIAIKEGNNKVIEDTYQYDPATKTFNRFNRFIVKEDYKKMSNADKEVFATANYTGIFRFDSDVASATNKESKVSANKKAVMLKLNALDVISNKKSIETKINLAR